MADTVEDIEMADRPKEQKAQPSKNKSDPSEGRELLSGWKLHGTTITVLCCVFLANLEVAIVSTSLVAITDDLRSFNRNSWIISSYLLTYTGFLMIWAKLSDSLGRRQCLCAALILFTIASGACGGAQTTDQLLVFRAFQGIGGAGLLSLPFVIIPEMVEPSKYALYVTFNACAFVFGYLFGPLFGGAILQQTTWRWIFFINLPLGVLTLVMFYIFMPPGFPDIHSKRAQRRLERLREIDVVGALLLFSACAFIVSALEEAGLDYPWSSSVIIVLLCLCVLSAVLFPIWQWHISRRDGSTQGIFALELMGNRVFWGALTVTFFAGIVFTVSVIQIPQEWQTVNAATPLQSGVRLLAFTLPYCVGTVISTILTSKLHVPPLFVVWVGATLQIITTCVISLVPVRIGPGKYLCNLFLGLGTGISVAVMAQFTAQFIRGKNQAAAMGAITQFRALGGVVGFAITSNVFNASVRASLKQIIGPGQVDDLLHNFSETLSSFSPETSDSIRDGFARAFDLEIVILAGFAGCQILASGLLWERKLRRLV